MKAVVQRVNNAGVTVENKVVSQIEKGLLVLLGVQADDTTKDADWLAEKIVNLRIFEDEHQNRNRDGTDDENRLQRNGAALVAVEAVKEISE